MPNPMDPLISLKQVGKISPSRARNCQLLSAVDLSIGLNDFIIITGPRRSGKSALLNLIGLLDYPTTGIIEFQGSKLNNLEDKKMSNLRNTNFGYVFQNIKYIPELSVLDNIQLPLLYRNGLSAKEKEIQLNRVLSFVKLSHMVKYYHPDNLSKIQKVQMAFARALVSSPKILLVDEPTERLDAYSREMVVELLRNITKIQLISLVLVTRDSYLIRKLNSSKVLQLQHSELADPFNCTRI